MLHGPILCSYLLWPRSRDDTYVYEQAPEVWLATNPFMPTACYSRLWPILALDILQFSFWPPRTRLSGGTGYSSGRGHVTLLAGRQPARRHKMSWFINEIIRFLGVNWGSQNEVLVGLFVWNIPKWTIKFPQIYDWGHKKYLSYSIPVYAVYVNIKLSGRCAHWQMQRKCFPWSIFKWYGQYCPEVFPTAHRCSPPLWKINPAESILSFFLETKKLPGGFLPPPRLRPWISLFWGVAWTISPGVVVFASSRS